MSKKRDSFSQLPSAAELQNILAAEVVREVPVGKKEAHYFEFSSLIKLADHFQIDASIFINDYTREGIISSDLLEKGKDFVLAFKESVLNKELLETDIEILNTVYDYLAEEDDLAPADIIFVFGAKTPLRIEKAVDLYTQNFSKTIVISGRGPFYGEVDAKTEAEIYTEIASESGVPREAMVTEDKSITVPDNVRCSLNLLDEKGVQAGSIILVNSPYTQRRGWAHFKKYTPDSVQLIRINSDTGVQYRRDTWFQNQAGIDVVLSEYLKAKVAVSLNTA